MKFKSKDYTYEYSDDYQDWRKRGVLFREYGPYWIYKCGVSMIEKKRQ